jgi:hypothetical protein
MTVLNYYFMTVMILFSFALSHLLAPGPFIIIIACRRRRRRWAPAIVVNALRITVASLRSAVLYWEVTSKRRALQNEKTLSDVYF